MVDEVPVQFTEFVASFRPAGEAAALERALQRLAENSAGNPVLYTALRDSPRRALQSVGVVVPMRTRIVCHRPRPGHCDLVIPLEELSPADWTPQVFTVLRRAVSDAGFAARLLAEPRSAIEDLLGLRLPSTVDLAVWKNRAEELHVVLPEGEETTDSGETSDSELSDAELELVAGGTARAIPWLACGGRKKRSAS